MVRSLGEFDPEDFPLLGGESTFYVAGKGLARLRITRVLEIVVADGELSVRLLDVGAVHDADVAASEDWPFLRVAGHRELRQIEIELLLEVDREDKGVHRFVSRPVLLARVPRQRSVAANNLSVLRFDESERVSDIITFLVKFERGEVVLAGSVEQSHGLDVVLGEEDADVLVVVGDPAV